MFSVGQKVECIDARGLTGFGHHGIVVEGQVYEVSGIETDGIQIGINVVGIAADEFPWGDPGDRYAWAARRFRPIVSRKTSIEIFQRMLTPKQKELAR